MRGLSYLLGFLFSNLLSAFVSAYGATGARIVPGIVNDCLQWKSTPNPDLSSTIVIGQRAYPIE